MARKSAGKGNANSQIAKQGNNPKFKVNKENVDNKRLFRWYNKTGLSNLRWSVFQETYIKNDIWEAKLSSLEFSRKFMCNKWVDRLKEGQKENVLDIIKGFSERYHDTTEIFRYLVELNVEDTAKKFLDIGMYFGFNQSLNEDLGLKFDSDIKVSDLIVSTDRFREVIKSTWCYQTSREDPSRRQFVGELLCNLLKVYVKCIVDAVRKLFIPRVVEGKIQTWDTRFPRIMMQSITEMSTMTSIKVHPESIRTEPPVSFTSQQLFPVDVPGIRNKDQNNNDRPTFWDLYSENGLFRLRCSIFQETEMVENIWEENWTNLSFAQRFMGDYWLSTLTEDERNYVMKVIDMFLITHSKVLHCFDDYLKIDEVVEFLSKVEVYFAFGGNLMNKLKIDFKKWNKPAKQILSFQTFRGSLESVSSIYRELQSGTRKPVRNVEFFNPFISKLINIQVRCFVDGIRSLFTCRFENENVKWEPRVDKRGCWESYEEQGWNRMDLEMSNFGSVNIGNVKEEEVGEDEDEEQKPCPSSL